MTEGGARKSKLRLGTRLWAGAIVGVAVAGLAVIFLETMLPQARDAGTMVAVAAGLCYAVIGLMVGLGTLAPDAGAAYLNVEDADEIREQRPSVGPAAVSGILIGLFLLVLAVAPRFEPSVRADILALIALACLAASVVTGFAATRRTDELTRQMSLEASFLTLQVAFVGLCVWAVLTRFGYAGWMSPLALVAGLALLQLAAIFWILFKRGLMRIR